MVNNVEEQSSAFVGVKKTQFTLKTITPMFLRGADGRTPELRPPSIKGMMRFWWRAIQCPESAKKLYEEEGKLFGSSEEGVGRSKLSIKISITKDLSIVSKKPLPNHTGDEKCPFLPGCENSYIAKGKCAKGTSLKAFDLDQSFNLELKAKNDNALFCNIFKVAVILGGLGARSRRGFGSVAITQENGKDFKLDYSLDEICGLLDKIRMGAFGVHQEKIINKVQPSGLAYPYIEEISVGKNKWTNYDDLLKIIAEAAHSYDCPWTGFAQEGRLASPIYVSVIKDKEGYKPIITKLHCAFEKIKDKDNKDKSKKNNLIDNIPKRGNTNYNKDNSSQFIQDILLANAGGKV